MKSSSGKSISKILAGMCGIVLTWYGLGENATAQDGSSYLVLNKPERIEWLQDAGFGMFIHFSFDSQLGIVISHSMAGASDDYIDRFIHVLPKTFNPASFDAKSIARIASLAGMKYIVFTAKHHSGFCMWDTRTTDFNIMNTEYGKDLLREYVDAVRAEGLAVGLYYSPEDFLFLHENGQAVRRRFLEPLPVDMMNEYVDYIGAQCLELMTNYGKIDVLFFDGGEGQLQEKAKAVCWSIQPDVLVTRGAMETPEQTLPGIAGTDPFEACITMGTQWQYKPTNDIYKSGTRLIEILIETRAKGGALLLNVGPKPDGTLPIEQEERLREMAAWHFINYEAVENVRPWILTNENNIWLTRKKDGSAVYAFITDVPEWPRGERKTFLLHSVRATPSTNVSILGQSGELVEYQPGVDAKTYWEQKEDGLEISCVRAQRIYNNHRWPNPIVMKLEGVEAALEPPHVQTVGAVQVESAITMQGKLSQTGEGSKLLTGFEFRPYAGFAESLHSDEWDSSIFTAPDNTNVFQYTWPGGKEGVTYEYRAVVLVAGIKLRGQVLRIDVK